MPSDTHHELYEQTFILVGCGAAKEDTNDAVPAKDLYTSTYFDKKRRYAEAVGDQWAILSAEHGVIAPSEQIEPYDTTIGDLDDDQLDAWVDNVGADLEEWVAWELSAEVDHVDIEVLAGKPYVDPLRSFLSTWDGNDGPVSVTFPFDRTSGIGEQMAWLTRAADQNQTELTEMVG